MERAELDKILEDKGNPLGKKQAEYIDAFYAKIGAISQGLGVATFAQPVIEAKAVPVVKGIPKNPQLVKELNTWANEKDNAEAVWGRYWKRLDKKLGADNLEFIFYEEK